MSEPAVNPSVVHPWHLAADPRSAACALGMGSILFLGFSDGAYYDGTWAWVGLALAAATGIHILLRPGLAPGAPGAFALAALGALAAWMLLSASWGIEGTEAQREAGRCAVYAIGLAAFLVIGRPSPAALLVGVLAGIVALAAFGLADRLLTGGSLDPYQGSLLVEPVGYANALGVLMAIGVVLALGLLADASGRIRRCSLGGSALVCTTALALTESRGAWLATLVGLGVLATLRYGASGAFTRRRKAIVGAVAVAAVITALPALTRVSLGHRPAYWSVALRDTSEHRVLGSGVGSFDDYWLAHRPIPVYVRDAHSLYLEAAAELGLVGITLLLCALGTPLLVAALAREARLVAGAAGGYSTFLVHAGIDWDWELPVTVLAGLACGAAILGCRADDLSEPGVEPLSGASVDRSLDNNAESTAAHRACVASSVRCASLSVA